MTRREEAQATVVALCVALGAAALACSGRQMPSGCDERTFATAASACALRVAGEAGAADRDTVATACLDQINAREQRCQAAIGAPASVAP